MRHFSKGGRLFAFLLAVLMMVSAIPVVAFAEETTPLTQSTADRIKDGAFKADAPYRIAMLDCGRKHFTVAQIKKLIDHLSMDGYNQLQLSFGNGGFRFLLDDMSISYGGLTLSDSTVRKYIADGNIVWGSEDKTCLTQDEMDEILLYAGRRSIEILPMLNVPAHCEGLVAGSPYGVEVKNQWGTKTWNLNVTSEDATNYGYGMLQKYATYFAARGVRFFNFGADEAEVASVVTGSTVASSFNAAIATFAAGAAELIKSVGMTPRCFNDVFMSGNSAALTRLKDAGTQVCYWQQTLGMTAKEIEALGFELINTNSDWYYVAHDTAASDRISYGGGYLKLPSLTNSVWPSLNDFRLSSGTQTLSNNANNVGSMFCLWFDKPDVYTADFLLDESHTYSALWQVGHMADIYWPSDVKPSLPTDESSTDATEPEEPETPVEKPEGATETEVNVTLKPGKTWTSDTYAWKGSLVTGEGDRAIAEATVSSGTRNEASSLTRKDPGFAAEETHLIGDGTNWLCVNADGSLYNTTDASKATKWVISGSKNNYVIFSNGHYLTYTRNGDQYVLATRSDPAVNTDDGVYSSTGVTTTRWQYGSSGVYGTQWSSEWGTARLPYLRFVSGSWKMFEADLSAFAGQSSPTYTYDYDPGYVGEYATVTFEGMGIPSKLTTTYYLTNGTDQTIKFNVTVEPETLDATDTQDVEMFLTSHWVGQTVVTPDTVADHIKTLAPAQAYGKYGVSLASLVLKKGVDEDSHEVWYWKGTKLTQANKQGSNEHISQFGGNGDDRTGMGTDFMYIRYWQGKWEIKATADGSWQSIASTDQLVAYYMQAQLVSPEITIAFRDYGKIAGQYYEDLAYKGTTTTGAYAGQEKNAWSEGFFGVGAAVVYPDRTLSPSEQGVWDNTLVLFYDHLVTPLRSPGVMKAFDSDDYKVTKITITWGHHVVKTDECGCNNADCWQDSEKHRYWDGDDSVAWNKKGDVAGEEWYDEETLWTRKEGVDYSEGILLDEALLSKYKTQAGIVGEAWLLLFYVEPVAKQENLKVVYYDDTLRKDIKNDIQISVPQDENFLTGLNNGENPVESGNIVLDDAAYITNSAGVNQTINKKLSQLEGIEDTYKKGNYYYVGADISEDGKTLTLHYAKKGTLNIIYWDDTTDQQIPTNSLIYYVPEGTSFLNGITYPDGDDEKTLTVTEGTRFDLPQYGCIYAFEHEGEEDINKTKCIYFHTDLADSAVNATLENRELYYHVNAEATSGGATLVLHYLRKNVLNIIYRDDVAETDIAEIEDFAETPYDKTFKDMVDDKITDKDGNEKTVEKDLSKLPDDKLPAGKKDDYKDYYVDRTEVSEDGLTLIIHYKAKSTLKVNYYDKTNENSLITFLTKGDAPADAAWTNTDGVWSAPTLTTPWTAELVLSSVPGVAAPYNVVGKYVLVAADTTTTDEGRTLNLYYELVTLPVTIVWVDEEGNQIEIETDYRIEYGKTLEDVLEDATVSGSDVTLGTDPTLTEWNGDVQPIIKDLQDLEDIDEKYLDGSYEYDKADLSEDGMTLTLHYVRKKDMQVIWVAKVDTREIEIWRDTTDPALIGLPWAATWDKATLSNGSYTAETDLTKIEEVDPEFKKLLKYADEAKVDGNTLYLYYTLAVVQVTVQWWDDSADDQITKSDYIIYDNTTLKDSLTDVSVDENGKATLGENPTLTDYEKAENSIEKDLLELWNRDVDEKYKTGLYEYVEADLSEDGKTLTLHYKLKTFDKSVSYVLDYGLPVKIDDLKGLFNKQYGIEKSDIQFIYYDEVVLNYAEVLWDDTDWNHLTYKLNKLMEGVDSLVLTAYVSDEAIEATLTLKFIPAHNIYYEDSFGFLIPEMGGFDLNGNDTQIEWETIDAGKELFQRADPVGSYRFYGSDPAYTNDGFGWSAGSALKVTVPYVPKGTSIEYPTLSFSFTGTGFDIISRTGADQGRIGVTIKQGTTVVKEYGVINRGDNELYQVPVMSVEGLEHGTYEVIITVYPPMEMVNRETGEKKFLYGTAQGATFVLDGIRIYDPVDTTKEENAEVLAAYEADGQAVLNRQEIRDLLINQGNELDVTVDQGMGTAADLEGFTNIGSNNEVYLMPGQSIEVEITLKAGEAFGLRARAMFEEARLNLTYTAQGQSDHFDCEDVSSAADTKWFNKYFPENTTITLTLTNASTETDGWIALTDLEIAQFVTVHEAQ